MAEVGSSFLSFQSVSIVLVVIPPSRAISEQLFRAHLSKRAGWSAARTRAIPQAALPTHYLLDTTYEGTEYRTVTLWTPSVRATASTLIFRTFIGSNEPFDIIVRTSGILPRVYASFAPQLASFASLSSVFSRLCANRPTTTYEPSHDFMWHSRVAWTLFYIAA